MAVLSVQVFTDASLSNLSSTFLISDLSYSLLSHEFSRKPLNGLYQSMVRRWNTLKPTYSMYMNIHSTLYLCSQFILSSLSKTVKSQCCQTQSVSNSHEDRWDGIWSYRPYVVQTCTCSASLRRHHEHKLPVKVYCADLHGINSGRQLCKCLLHVAQLFQISLIWKMQAISNTVNT